MDDLQCKVAIGSMLHDIGKVLYRSSDGRSHSRSGYDFLKDEVGIADREILEQVLYHHADMIRGSRIATDSPAYITYIADNIASAADRRKKEDKDTAGFDRSVPLESIFNILNENHTNLHYMPSTMDERGRINYPTNARVTFDSAFYGKIEHDIKDTLKGLAGGEQITVEYINSLLTVLEAYLTYIPSSTDRSQLMDISLYDHMKLTAALAGCILTWLRAEEIQDYRNELFSGAKEFYTKKVFYLYSMDISGIQSFIYHQYGTDDVLKNLRARSFYLEIMMENFVDTLLRSVELSRANLLYSGGGHAYLILPNTEEGVRKAEELAQSTNAWLQETFGTELYLGTGGVECSAKELCNEPEGSYGALFRTVSRKVSATKTHRYSADQIRQLNSGKGRDGARECKICHRSDRLTDEGKCSICSGLTKLSKKILDRDMKFYVITGGENTGSAEIQKMPIYRDMFMEAADERSVRRMIAEKQDGFISAYSKNEMHTGYEYATNLWVADYSRMKTLEELVKNGKGIQRLGVIRADVDNLGTAFVSGFPQEYQTISRAATFSRTLSMFFKWHVNNLLENGAYQLETGGKDICEVNSIGSETGQKIGTGRRNATVIYAGGDDLFIVGAWKDIIEFAVDLHRSLEAFSIGTLKISAGIGIYDAKYPISYIASQSGDLESASKELEGKNAVTLFTDREWKNRKRGDDRNGKKAGVFNEGKEHTYRWDEFINEVLGEKFKLLNQFFSFDYEAQDEIDAADSDKPDRKRSRRENEEKDERGKAFLYNILELFREADEKINLARLAYLLARLEPQKKKGDKRAEKYREIYKEFKQRLYEWQRDEKDRKQFITAIYIYAYLTRGKD